jgi:hypothetical protein
MLRAIARPTVLHQDLPLFSLQTDPEEEEEEDMDPLPALPQCSTGPLPAQDILDKHITKPRPTRAATPARLGNRVTHLTPAALP